MTNLQSSIQSAICNLELRLVLLRHLPPDVRGLVVDLWPQLHSGRITLPDQVVMGLVDLVVVVDSGDAAALARAIQPYIVGQVGAAAAPVAAVPVVAW